MPGIVFAQRAAQTQHLAGRLEQYDFERQQVVTDIAITNQPCSTGVGRHHAAYRRVGAQINRKPQAMRLQPGIELLQRQPGIHRHAAVKRVNVAAAAQPAQRQNDLATGVVGRAGADQPGVGTLGQHRHALRGA